MILVYRNTNSDSRLDPQGSQYLQQFKWASQGMRLVCAHVQADDPPDSRS